MPKYRYTDPGTGKSYISGEKLTPDELDEAFGANTPPLSAASGAQGQPEQAATKLGKVGAITSRVGFPLIGGAIGALTPIPGGAAIGGAIGAGLGTVAGSEIEGKPTSALEVGTQAALGLIAPGAGSTVVKGALKAGAYGFASETIESLTKGEGLPEPGHVALGAIVGALTGGVITKFHLRSALKEVLPSDVADEAHSLLTTGKLETPTPSEAVKDEVKELNRIRKFNLIRVNKEVRSVIRGAKGRYESKISLEPGGVDIASSDIQKGPVKPITSLTYELVQPSRLFDRMQTQTGLPTYTEVFKPIQENLRNPEALEKELRRIKVEYLENPDVDKAVKNAVGGLVKRARGINDGTYGNLVESIKQFKKSLPIFNKEMSDETAHKLANTLLSAPQMAVLGYKPGPAARVLSHILQTGYMQLGEKGLAVGIKQALSRPGWAEARAVGVLEGSNTPEEVEALTSKANSWLGKIVDWGFAGIRGSANLSRVITYQGQKRITLDAARKAGGNIVRFIDKANLDIGLERAEAAQIAKLYSQGRVQEAAVLAGKARANASVPLHSRVDRPMFATGSTRGRLAGSLSTWPTFYGNLLYESFIRGPAPVHKKALAFGRWMFANAILSNFIARPIYESMGDEPEKAKARAEGFTYLAPIFYELGPAIDAYQGGVEGAKEFVQGRNKYQRPVSRGKALLHMTQAIKPVIPYSYAATDLYQAFKKTQEDR